MAIPEKNAGRSFANFLSEVSQISLGHLAIINHQIANRESTFENFLSHVRATNRFFMSSNTLKLLALAMGGIFYDSVTWNKCVMLKHKGVLFRFCI